MNNSMQRHLLFWSACLVAVFFATSASAQFFQAQKKVEEKKVVTKQSPKKAPKKAQAAPKKPRPAPKKAAPKKAAAPDSSAVVQLLEELKTGQEALRQKVDGLSALGEEGDAEEPMLTPEQESRKAALEKQSAEAQAQLDSLEQAIQGGLDPAVVQDSKAALEKQSADLKSSIAAIQPTAEEGEPETDAELQALIRAVEDLKEALATLENATGGEEKAESEGATEEEDSSIGIGIEFGLASAYVFRGLNVFMSGSQQDQHVLFAPGLSWALGDSGVSLGYWSAYQINGGNQEEMVAVALGHEQDLYVSWEKSLTDRTSLAVGLVYYFYPFADKEDAGCKNPSFLEPGAGIAFSGGVDLGLDLAYFAGLQEAVRGLSYLYIHPSIGKGFELNSILGTSIGLGFGYKVFKDSAGEMSDNMFDISLDWDLSIQVTDAFSVSPGVHVAWTNLEDVEIDPEDGSDPIKDNKRMGEEYVVFFSLTSGWEL